MDIIRGTHHLTMSVGPAQDDYDFHTGLLGLFSVKKTVLFDGKTPIYHLYYGNRAGDVSTLLTSFPFRQAESVRTFAAEDRLKHRAHRAANAHSWSSKRRLWVTVASQPPPRRFRRSGAGESPSGSEDVSSRPRAS